MCWIYFSLKIIDTSWSTYSIFSMADSNENKGVKSVSYTELIAQLFHIKLINSINSLNYFCVGSLFVIFRLNTNFDMTGNYVIVFFSWNAFVRNSTILHKHTIIQAQLKFRTGSTISLNPATESTYFPSSGKFFFLT